MNEFAVFAFVVMPLLVVALGYVAMRLHGREADRLGGGIRRSDPRPRADAGRTRIARPDRVAESADRAPAVQPALDAQGRLDGLVNWAGIVTGNRVLGRDGATSTASRARCGST